MYWNSAVWLQVCQKMEVLDHQTVNVDGLSVPNRFFVQPVRILMVTYIASLLQTLSPSKPKALALDICPSVLEPTMKQLREVHDCRAGSQVSEVMLGQENLEEGIVSFPSAPQRQYIS